MIQLKILPRQPIYPQKEIKEYIYSSYSESYSDLDPVITDLETKLRNKGLEELIPIDARKIGYEFDSSSSYSSASFYYPVDTVKPDALWKKEIAVYDKALKKYKLEKKKYEESLKSIEIKKLEKRKKLYEKLKKEFEND